MLFPYIRLPMRAMPFDCSGRFPPRRDDVLGCPSWRIEHYPNDSCYACKRDEEAGKLHAEDDGKGDGHGKDRQGRGRFLLSARKGLPNALPTSIASRIWLLSINPSARRFAATAEDCTRPPNCAATAERSSVGKSSVTAWGGPFPRSLARHS